eukprot:scaffold145506_cov256-Phaeocystis_antarctica.AAC.1
MPLMSLTLDVKLSGWSNAVAPVDRRALRAVPTLHMPMKLTSWFIFFAPPNMWFMSVTLDVSNLIGWSNTFASWNMWFMSVTLDVSNLISWSNTLASWNMWFMSVTLDVSKLSSWSNAFALWNMWFMLVTLDVSKLINWSIAFAPEHHCADERALRPVVTLFMPTPSGWLNADAP